MTNLNLDLIEKVKNDNISIFVGKNGDRDLLIKLLTCIYPNQKPPTSCNWEYYQNDNGNWVSLSHTSREAIPISAFFTEPTLTVEEQVLISDMNERLKRLEDLYFSKGQETKQPIDTTEGEQEQGKEQAPIETEQRWKPEHGEEVYAANNNPLKFIFTNQAWHLVMYEAGMLFKTEEEAIKHYVFLLIVNGKKEAIKQYLSINKF